ncbi:MAG: PfkB family carbohydrate kinase [Marinoscillum sp.]
MAFNSIQEVFDAFTKLKVLVIGDSMIDTYIYGQVNRISPEAPVPIVNVSGEEHRLGGAANVALNLKALGIEVKLCSVCGKDASGEHLIQLLKEQGLSSSGMLEIDGRQTTVKKRVMSGSQHLLRVDHETDQYLTSEQNSGLSQIILPLIPAVDLIIFEDYDKGVISKSLIDEVVSLAQLHHVPVAVDPKFRNYHDYKGVDLFKPNLVEFKKSTTTDSTDLMGNAQALVSQLKLKNLLLTLSSKGVLYCSEKLSGQLDAHIREVADVSGAGDTVIALAGAALALGLSITFIAEFANLGGGIVCEYPGVVPIIKSRLLDEAKRSDLLLRQLV